MLILYKLVDLFMSEPVRIYVYSVLVAVMGLLLGLGVITAPILPLIITVGATVLSIGGVEKARSQVSPTINKTK